jgi:hypothetical protein
MEKKEKTKKCCQGSSFIFNNAHTYKKKKREKEKGILEKSTAQPNPKFGPSKCVASWTQSNYTIIRASFHQVVVTLKSTPIKKLSIAFVSSSSQSSTSQALTKCNYESTQKSLESDACQPFLCLNLRIIKE